MGCPVGTSGKFGRVLVDSCNVTHLTRWDFRGGAEPQTYFPASESGFQAAIAGAFSGSGSFTYVKSASDTADFTSGDCVQLQLYHNVAGTMKWSGYAVLGERSIEADLAGAVQLVTYAFTSTGSWTET